ncbi:hypothetical protein DPMN_007592 [Dreissena polymorpha]|uniref:Uncharacterized protein n=1 Tax=Dreissena polymorpha TaxID=45954 RepID=A0A9D4MYR8_DREPO|nr:hypothetical protein DPMN_007592 [Dreissena polymorpha]
MEIGQEKKNAPSPGGNVYHPNRTIFQLVQDIIRTILVTKFHEGQTINVASRVLTRTRGPERPKFQDDWTINVASSVLTWKNAPPLGSHVFQANIEQLIFYNSHLRKNAPPPGGHVFQSACIILELIQVIYGNNLLTQVLTSHIWKNAPSLGSHVFQANITICKLIQDIIETNLLTKFHEDWTRNVASKVLTRLMLTPQDAQQTKGNHKSSP